MTQVELINRLFTEKGQITNGDFLAHGMHFTGRNRVTESSMKAHWASKGYYIEHFFGDDWKGNGWRIVKAGEATVATVAVERVCLGCGVPFKSRERDVKRGLGLYHSRSCSGAAKGKPRAGVESLAGVTVGGSEGVEQGVLF
jgi:hypothetical protein